MNIYHIPMLISGILCLLLSIITWLLRSQESINRAFAFFSLTMAFDSFSYFSWYQYGNLETMHIWMRIVFIVGLFVPIGMIFFFFSFTGFDRNGAVKIAGIPVRYFKFFTISLFVSAMVLSAFTQQMLLIPENPEGIWDTKMGNFGKIFVPFFALIFLYMMAMAIKSYKMAENRARKHFIIILALGTLVWVITGYTSMILLGSSGLKYDAVNYIGVIVMLVIYFIAVVNYQVDKMRELNADLQDKVRLLENEIVERERVENLAREQQEKLLQADKMASIGILVSGVAHEINNPNNYMQLNSNNLSDVWKELNPFLETYAKEHRDFSLLGMPFIEISEEITSMIKALNEGPERIRKIVQTLKDFARKDPGDIDQLVDVNAVVEAAMTILANMIKKTTNNFKCSLGKDIPPIKGNFQQLEQVIINLISNSCQALDDGSKGITVSSAFEKHSDTVIITVKDEGAGIAEDDMKFIMDPFFTTKRENGGTGLGLSISYKIVHDFHGELLFSSERNKGTEAKIILPACTG